jgi:hypothetical protein
MPLSYSDIMPCAAAGLEAARKSVPSTRQSWLLAGSCLAGIGLGFAIEMATLTSALSTQYQELSTGENLGANLMPLRVGIGGVLLLSHVLLHKVPDEGTSPWRRHLSRIRYLPIAAIIGGMSLFMFTVAMQATSGDDGGSGLAGVGIGLVTASLFSISFLACTRLMGILIPAVRQILEAGAQKAALAVIERDIAEAERLHALSASLVANIKEAEQPDALKLKAAREAASRVGLVAADAHAVHADREAIDGVEVGPDDVVEGISDAPIKALGDRAIYLKSMTVAYFLNLLK